MALCRAAVGILASLCAAATARAQSLDAGAKKPTAEQTARAVIPSAHEDGLRATMARIGTPGEASTARTGAEAILEATSGGGKVKARFGFKVGPSFFIDSTLSGKVDTTTDRTAVADLDTALLSDDGEFSIGGSWIRSTAKLRATPTIVADISKVCERLKTERGATSCSTGDAKLTADDQALLRSFIDIGTAYSAGLRLTMGRSKFSYRPAVDQPKVDEHHNTPVALMATFAATASSNLFVGAQLGGERTWKAADSKTLCSPTAAATVFSCESIAVGTPDDSSGFVGIFETRYFFDGKHFYSRGAIAPRFEYRQAKNLKVLEIPYYFLSDPDKGGWTGGVMLRVKNGDPAYVVFVGPALPFFGF